MPALELDPIEARVLGVLIEKEYTTPEQYPLTMKALAAGCNQLSNRAPVLDLSETEVAAALERLRRKTLVGASHASGSRVERYRHSALEVWSLSPPELAVLTELMLRGAQMPGELRSRAARMSPIDDVTTLNTLLETLRGKGFVQRLEPLPGARAPQWDQIVAGTTAHPPSATSSAATGLPRSEVATRPAVVTPAESIRPESAVSSAPKPASDLELRLQALENEVRRLGRLYEDLARGR